MGLDGVVTIASFAIRCPIYLDRILPIERVHLVDQFLASDLIRQILAKIQPTLPEKESFYRAIAK